MVVPTLSSSEPHLTITTKETDTFSGVTTEGSGRMTEEDTAHPGSVPAEKVEPKPVQEETIRHCQNSEHFVK